MTRMQQIAMSTIPSGQGSSWPRAGANDGLVFDVIAAQAGSAQLDPGAIYQRLALDLSQGWYLA